MQVLTDYREQVRQELTGNILPFYLHIAADKTHGGYYGTIANDQTIDPRKPKGLVQHSRLLWTFAYAYRRLGQLEYREAAVRAYRFLTTHFWDADHGGYFWLVDRAGAVLDRHKIIYGQAFAIYGLSEYYLAAGDQISLARAIALFDTLERQAVDPQYGGYFEAFSAGWRFSGAINVDETAEPTVKSMNTHLHLLEAYTHLLRAWDDAQLRARLRALITIMLEYIIDRQRSQMKHHFSADWQSLTDSVSYGHDIEASWLLVEAAQELGDADLLAETSQMALRMAQVVYERGLDSDGGLRDDDHSPNKVWWPQAEAMVGFFNAYQLSGQARFLHASFASWAYIQQALVDRQHGEWLWGVDGYGRPLRQEKAGLWKTPYHNGRACLEIMQRIAETLS